MENKLSDLDISDINYDICSMLYKGDFNKCIGYGDEKLTLAISIFVYRSLYTNPFYVAELKQHTGLEDPVRDYVLKWDEARGLEAKLCDLLDYLIPLYRKEGKSQLVISVGCTGGRHRSVVFAELLKAHLEKIGCIATVQHRDMKK